MELRLSLPKMHGGQVQVLGSDARNTVVACGRRWGKTELGVHLAIRSALAGRPVAWGAPHYKYLAEPFRRIRRLIRPLIARVSETDRRMELLTGGSIDFWTLSDENAGRGYKYAQWIIDESAMVVGLEEIYWNAIRPTLTDLSGDAWLLSTPRGSGFFRACFELGQDESQSEWRSFRMPTDTNPWIRLDEIARARRAMPETSFRQEFEAHFLEAGDGFFYGLDQAIRRSDSQNAMPDPTKLYLCAVDLARIRDFTVITVLDEEGHQVWFDRFRGVSWARQIERIKAVCREFACSAVVDATGLGDPLVERLRGEGIDVIPVVLTQLRKQSLLEHLALFIESGQISLMDIPVQSEELANFRVERREGAGFHASAPAGMHDDCVMALALAAGSIQRARPEIWIGGDSETTTEE